jgi:hypothetical protein
MEEIIEPTEKKQRVLPPHLFKKGQSGNLNGRPRGVKNFTSKVRSALESVADGKGSTWEKKFVEALLDKAVVEKDPGTMKLIWNYLDGMPNQTVDMTTRRSLEDLIDEANEIQSTDSDAVSFVDSEQEEDGAEVLTEQGAERLLPESDRAESEENNSSQG